ncbi:hypothetical protein CNF03280 [Cryptococcus deneoformans JEC21]|uniref:Uncharacterized protein n=1 Tax=Cryptococcus deneoformans (strain JEC21 / ATCC MYA-565) TaxID=214684 RepID=Q5KF29_CRYD1|nr:hypothetical protein CNF03280 [Cryptococcus neoformans var. neoformans JEC21]AAW44094.2 hypothetical protein CNF03280 [Cryptococcus neoformans var. neoformans JEC21]
MPPKRQTPKDTPLPEEVNSLPVDGDLNSQIAAAILYLSKLVGQQNSSAAAQGNYAPRGISIPEASDIPTFTGPIRDVPAVILHTDRLYKLLRTYSLFSPGNDDVREENRRVTILELANNSIECKALQAWVRTTGRMMEEDGESGWEECIVAFKDAAMPLEWAQKEFRSLFRLQFNQVSDWPTFDQQAIQHRHNLMGTELYPSDTFMANLYRAACPEILFLRLMTKPEFKNGSLSEVCTQLQLEVRKYLEEKKEQFTPTRAKAQNSATPQTQPHLAHPVSHYYQAQNPLPYYLSPAGKHIRKLFAKENRCNDCRKVGHNFKTCPSRRPSMRSNPHPVDNHEDLIQELTSQLDDYLKLETFLDLDETSWQLAPRRLL